MYRPTVCLAASLGLAASPLVLAQSPEPDDAELDQIIVTGARTPINADHLGNATTVIDRSEIERLEVRYVSDLLRTVPGFAVSRSGGVGSQTQVRVRGAEANHVLVLIDGVRANDPATGDEFRWEYLTTGNVDRVEIVRGPQSALWGSDAVAAVVHVVTSRQRREPSIAAYAEGGSNDTGNVGLNGSAGSDRWSLTGGIEYLGTDGINVSRTGTERDGSDITTVSFGGRIEATEALTFDAGIRTSDAWTEYDAVDYVVTGLPADADLVTEADNLYADIGATYARTGSRLKQRMTARFFDSNNRNLLDGMAESSTASDRTTFMYQADIGLGDHRLSLALEHEATDFSQRGAAVFGDPNQDQEMDVTSFIGDFEAHPSDRLTVLLSARFDKNSDFEDATTGRVSAAHLLSERTTLRANVGIGQKNPTFIERFGFFPAQFVGNADLKPERSTSYEIGIDRAYRNGAFIVGATLFHQDLEDEINGFVFDPVTFLTTAENLIADSRRSGFELTAEWQASEQFDLAASYTYTDASEQDGDGQDIAELRRPRHSGSLSANFLSSGDRLKASLSASYGGSRNDIFFPPFPAPSEIVTLDNYWLVDLAVHYSLTDTMTLFARGANLLDEDYEQVYGFRTPGITGYVGLRTRFGSDR
jgi:vitamin B12 transporter